MCVCVCVCVYVCVRACVCVCVFTIVIFDHFGSTSSLHIVLKILWLLSTLKSVSILVSFIKFIIDINKKEVDYN